MYKIHIYMFPRKLHIRIVFFSFYLFRTEFVIKLYILTGNTWKTGYGFDFFSDFRLQFGIVILICDMYTENSTVIPQPLKEITNYKSVNEMML